ncbi:unnamed protein product [Ascophyllum nodosum]
MATASSGLMKYDRRTDRPALSTFFKATGGPYWRQKRGWEDGSDNLDVWGGVSVNASRRAIRINVMENNLKGNIPAEIWHLTELERVELGKNELTGPVPPILPENRLWKLTVLNLGNNKLTGNLPDLHLFPNLEEVYLNNNEFTGPLSEDIGLCEKLKILYLFSNQLKGPLPSSLGNLVNLTKLHISDNQFSGAIPEECIHMRKLTEFKVQGIDNLTKPSIAGARNSYFNKWMRERKLEEDLKHLKFFSNYVETAVGSGAWEPFPRKKEQGVLLEGPLRVSSKDYLGFGDYADVLVDRLQKPEVWPVGLGIFAQWGAGKSTLCELIIHGLQKNNSEPERRAQWFTRWLWTTSGGAVLYGLVTGVITAVSRRCCRSSPPADEESRVGESTSGPVVSIVASFDAWLFADSDVLWAVLVSKIFEQVSRHRRC